MAAAYEGGVILAADSRTSTGRYVANRAAGKLTQIADRVFVCRSGSAADTQAVAGYVQFYIAQHQAESGRELLVANAAELCMQARARAEGRGEQRAHAARLRVRLKGSPRPSPLAPALHRRSFMATRARCRAA